MQTRLLLLSTFAHSELYWLGSLENVSLDFLQDLLYITCPKRVFPTPNKQANKKQALVKWVKKYCLWYYYGWNICVSPKLICWGGIFGRWSGLMPLKWRPQRDPLIPSCHVKTQWWAPSINQRAGSQEAWTLLVPWSWTSQPPALWEINFCYL
jgi:hypothetical protein